MLYAVFAREQGGWTFRKAFERHESAVEFTRISKWLYPEGMEIRLYSEEGVV